MGGVGPGQWERAARGHGQPGINDVCHKYKSDVTGHVQKYCYVVIIVLLLLLISHLHMAIV